jgi:hypothetical protein
LTVHRNGRRARRGCSAGRAGLARRLLAWLRRTCVALAKRGDAAGNTILAR